MIDNWRALELIERAEREAPFCACGQPNVPVGRNGGVWLECASLQTLPDGRIRRLLSTLDSRAHTRRLIVDEAPIAA